MSKIPEGSLINFMSSKVKEHGGINMAQGLPGFEPPTELLEILKSIINNPIHQYPPNIGNFKILDILTKYYSSFKTFTRENLLITQGATEAISLIFLYLKKTLKTNFSVMAFDPYYESYSNLPLQFGHQFFEAEMYDNGSFDEDLLETKIKVNNIKLFFTCSPGNPLGKIIPKSSYLKLLEICKRNNCYVVIDAVYKEVYFDEKPYIPIEHVDERVFYVNSFSKLLSITGWRIGYLITDVKSMKEIRQIHNYTGLCASSILQEAIAIYLENNNLGLDYISKLRPIFKNNFKVIADLLTQKGFKIPQTDGGYFIWSQLPERSMDGFDIAVDLYDKTKLAIVPGIHFSKNATNYVRFNIARKEQEIEKAIVALNTYF